MSQSNDRIRRQLVLGLLQQLHLERMSERFNPRFVQVAFNTVNAGISIGLIAVIAQLTQQAFMFPSLGAMAFLLFYVPLSQSASPRNALTAHTIGAVVGWSCLTLFGLQEAPSVLIVGMDWWHAGAATVSLSITAGLMTFLRVPHPPAGATTLVVTLGLMPQLHQIVFLLFGVVLLLIQAFVMNRLAGIPYPVWSQRNHDSRHELP